MKILLSGDNNFEIERRLSDITDSYEFEIFNIDGSSIDIDIHAALLGQNLFSSNRLVIVRNISSDARNLETLVGILPNVSEDISIVIVDQNLDKRTKLYKDLIKNITLEEYTNWGEYDDALAIDWTNKELKKRNIEIDKSIVKQIVERSGMNQWNILHAIEKIELSDAKNINIDDIIEPFVTDNVFKLLETALSKDAKQLESMIAKLRINEDPFRLFALIVSQFLVIVAIVNSSSADNVAKDLGASPYMVSKLNNAAKNLSAVKCKTILNLLSEGDEQIKSSTTDPWVILSKTLIKIASI